MVAAFDAAQQMAWSREELDAYDMRGIYIQDERGHITFAKEEGREEGIQEGLEKGLEKGREEGRQEGLEKGLEEGRRAEGELVLRLLARRIGAVPAEQAETVRGLSSERLGELGEALLELSSLGDLEDWLVARGPESNSS